MNMKARDLIDILENYPDMDINISVDVSTCDNDYEKRAFSDDSSLDYQIVGNVLTLMFEGYTNY